MNESSRPDLILTTSPFVKAKADTAWIMWQVNYAMIPVIAAAVWFYGLAALLILTAAALGAVVMERISLAVSDDLPGHLRDGSAILTGLLLGLTLPPGIPLWMAFAGGVISIGLGKTIFGGIGGNVFNPALVGRAFLQAAFPVALTTWPPVAVSGRFMSIPSSVLTLPMMSPEVDAVSTATPLAEMYFDGVPADLMDLMLGSTTGSLGEASGLILILCGIYLVARQVMNWRIPVATVGSLVVAAVILHWMNPEVYPTVQFHIFSGGLLLGAIFMATDPVTSPLTHAGCWVFGIGIGVLVLVIRQFGGLPEGVMYAILLMNAFTPLIDRMTQPRTFGTAKRVHFTR